MSSNIISQTIFFPDSKHGEQQCIKIEREIEFFEIPESEDTCIFITDPDFDLYTIFSAQLLRTDQKFKFQALDEFFKLYLQAIVVTDSENLGFINYHERKILRDIISTKKASKSPPLELKERPLGKKSLIEDDLCILRRLKLLIIFEKVIYEQQKDLLKRTGMLIKLFNHSKK